MKHRVRYWAAVCFAMTTVGVAACARVAPLPGPAPLGLDLYVPSPPDNPLRQDRIDVGRRLFFDPIVSRDSTMSCASCHQPERAFTDGRVTALGIDEQHGTRNTPTLLNRGYGGAQFRDGRAASLEEAVLMPIQSAAELDLPIERLADRLRNAEGYPGAFGEAFRDGVTQNNIARALASFVRTLRSGGAQVDRYLEGDRDALREDARRGARLFYGKAGCSTCHAGPNFSDELFHNTGVAVTSGDSGRFGVTRDSADVGSFRTPSLRNVAQTAPYMHDGSIEHLGEVIQFYDEGGKANPNLDRNLRPLGLSATERAELESFLRGLSGIGMAG